MKASLLRRFLCLILLVAGSLAPAAPIATTKATPAGSTYDPGCGPRSAASLLRWWRDSRGVATFTGAAAQGDAAQVQRAEKELMRDMQTFNSLLALRLPGGQRATWPWEYTAGLNAYLERHGISLRARGVYGAGLTERDTLLAQLRDKFGRGEPVVALLFAPDVQHYGRLKGYEVDERGRLWGVLANPIRTVRGDLIRVLDLSGTTSFVSGVFWLEPVA